jgi:hypothetical protein
MLAYAEGYDCEAILLIYPWNPAGGEHASLRKQLVFEGGGQATVTVGELSLENLSGVGTRLRGLLKQAGVVLQEELCA